MALLTLLAASAPASIRGQRQRKGDGCPQCLSGDNISVNRDRQTCVAGPGGGQVSVHAGVDRCLFSVQHAEGRQCRRRCTDSRNQLAARSKVLTDLFDRGIGFEIRHAGDTAGQDAGIKGRIVQFLSQRIGHHMDAAGACDGLLPAHCGDRDLHTGAAQNIHAEQALAFLQPGGKKDNSFRHSKHLLIQSNGWNPLVILRTPGSGALRPRRVCTSPTRERASTSSVRVRPISLPCGRNPTQAQTVASASSTRP